MTKLLGEPYNSNCIDAEKVLKMFKIKSRI